MVNTERLNLKHRGTVCYKSQAWSRQGPSPHALVGVPARGEGTLTGQNSGHEGGKHEEEHGEEQEAGVAQDLLGFVPDAQVQQANEEADPDV